MARTPRSLPDLTGFNEPASPEVAEPLTEIAYRRIKAAILDASLPPGLQAAEQQIAAQLGMSRTPVHMAIYRLQHEGWMTLTARRGVVIAPIVPEEMHFIYETMTALESTAVTRLASRPANIDDGIDDQISRACEATETALAQNNLAAWAKADGRFHDVLVEASGNPHLARLAFLVMEQTQRARNLTLRLRPIPVESTKDHRRIVERIVARDPEGARMALEHHRARGIEVLVPILEAIAQPSKFLRS